MMRFRGFLGWIRYLIIFALCFSFLPALAQIPLLIDIPPARPALPDHLAQALTVEGGLLIDHNSVELFDHIPENYLTAARSLRIMFSDRSVGENINGALDCLVAVSWAQSPSYCRRDYYDSNWNVRTFTQRDLDAGLVPERILFSPDPTAYDRSNWVYEFRIGEWQPLVSNFVLDLVPTYIDAMDILTFQFSYLNIEEGSDIDDTDKGFFVDLPHYGYYPNGGERWDISDVEELEANYPDKIFFYWTASLARSIGSVDGTNFNNQMRQYAAEHNKILFDAADIEAHNDQGLPCYDNRDGFQYCNMSGVCEDHPDDGQDIPAICQDYTTEVEGGHLGNVSGGKIRVAKAFWVLMARIAGWDGVVSTPDPSATLTQTVTPTGETTPTATPTLTATSTDTATVTQTDTPTPTASKTSSPTATQTSTYTPIATAADTATATQTETATPTATSTETPTATETDTPTLTATETPSPTATQTRTSTPTVMATVSPIFADGFESGDLSAWSASKTGGGDLSVTTAAAHSGSFGLQAVINGGNPLYVQSEHPDAETGYSAGFYYDPNSIAMEIGDSHPIFQGFSASTFLFQLEISYSSNGYALRLIVVDDNAYLYGSDLLVIQDAYQNITLTWTSASNPGANDGTLALDVDAIPRLELVGIDNDTHRLDLVRLGALGGIERGTRGTYYFDEFVSYR